MSQPPQSHPREMKMSLHEKIWIRMFIAALLVMGKTENREEDG